MKAYIDVCDYLKSDQTTDDSQLNDAGHHFMGKRYIGTFSADTFPTHIPAGTCCIINTDPSYKQGLHWVSIYECDGNVYFFDTYDRPHSKLFKKPAHWIDIDHDVVESKYSSNCGQLSMAMLISH